MLGLHCCVRVFSSCWKWVLLFSFSAQACNCSGFPAAHTVKNPPAMWETWVRYLSWEDPLEKEMVTHSSILAWRITWTEEPGRLQSMGSQRVGHDWVTLISLHCASLDLTSQRLSCYRVQALGAWDSIITAHGFCSFSLLALEHGLNRYGAQA